MKHCRIISILFLIFCVGSALAQDNSTIDSLKQLLKKDHPDSLKISHLIKLGRLYYDLNPKQGLDYVLLADSLAGQSGVLSLRAKIIPLIANLYMAQGEYQKALEYDIKALQWSEYQNDDRGIAFAYNNLGTDYMEMDNYGKAYEYFNRSLEKSTEIEDSLLIAVGLHNIGTVFKVQKNYDQALQYINDSRAISKSIDDIEGEAYSLQELGEIAALMGNLDIAINYLWKSLSISEENDFAQLLPFTQVEIANLYVKMGDLKKALEHCQKGLLLHENWGNKAGMAEALLVLGKIYQAHGQDQKADSVLQKGLPLAIASDTKEEEAKIYYELYELALQDEDYQQALHYFESFHITEDSILNMAQNTAINKLHAQYEFEEKDREIASQMNKIHREEFLRNVLVVILALFGFLIINLYRSGKKRKKIHEQLLAHQAAIEKQSSELEEVNRLKDKFFSIISHDLRSPINSLHSMMDLLESEHLSQKELTGLLPRIKRRISHAKSLLDNLLEWALLQMNKINVKKEIIVLRDLVEQNIGMLKDFNDKSIEIKNEIDISYKVMADPNMIDLIFRNLISNALKFSNEGGEIKIEAEKEKGFLTVAILDNGIGLDSDSIEKLFNNRTHYSRRGTANEKGTGLGLKLCKEFVEKNGGEIWAEINKGGGSTFKFTLPSA